MSIRITNWKLLLLGLLVVSLLAGLGFWQLSRGHEKEALLKSFKSRTAQAPLTSQALLTPRDFRFYRATLTGTFDNQHTLLLDNKTFNGQVGYEIYTPFHADGLADLILIDRGFTPIGATRDMLPAIKPIDGKVTVQGMLNLPPRYVALGAMTEKEDISWPLRVEYINTQALGILVNSHIFPYTLTLEPKSPYALSATAIEWNIFTVSPERHMAYAFQWFALAVTLLVICAALSRK